MKIFKQSLLPLLLAICMLLSACSSRGSARSAPSAAEEQVTSKPATHSTTLEFTLDSIPVFSGSPYVTVNNNQPYFTDADFTITSFELYSELDSLGRCGVAFANLSKMTMPTKDRESIGQVKPSGWHTVKYDFVDGKYLYNRCHLIGYQLTAENANTKNLITGTRYLNVEGMLPFENIVADYITETGNHVLYRVTPIFEGNNLITTGVLMEAESIEDKGAGICFNVYCYNNQPGVTINYATGDSVLSGDSINTSEDSATTNPTPIVPETEKSTKQTYMLNTNTHKFHHSSCSIVADIKGSNKQTYSGTRENLIVQGYEPCERCKP